MNYGMGKQPNINGKVAKERLEPKMNNPCQTVNEKRNYCNDKTKLIDTQRWP